METLVYDPWKNRTPKETDKSAQGRRSWPEDVITIDSQIDLKVRGDLPATKILNEATAFVERKMVTEVEEEYENFKIPQLSILNGVLDYEGDQKRSSAFEEFRKVHVQKFSEMSEREGKGSRSNKFFFSVEPGFEIIIPPYDKERASNFVSFSSADKVSGSFKSFPVGNGYGSSGMGVFLSPTEDVSASFRAHCPVSYAWVNFISEGGGYAASRGGVGLTIYNASVGTVIQSGHEVVWDQSRRPSEFEISGGSKELYFQNTTLGQAHFDMKSGQIYFVWMWCWAFADSGPNAAAYANIDCNIPFLIIDAATR